MDGELWGRLGNLFYAAGLGILASLGSGLALVPYFQRRRFVSRESKEGVRQGARDQVPMGGGFILLAGLTAAVLILTYTEQIRRGYTGCFLIAFWGFALLGYLDDRSKVRATGYSDKAKVILQVCVTLLFAISFYLYARDTARMPDVGLVGLPFVGHIGLGFVYVPFVMVFLFYVSNAVNITDGFDGLAGGVGAVVAAAYAIVCFLIGASELGLQNESETLRRMFALSLISAALAGSLVAYLYFNFTRGVIYFGDTGSMALGAAIAFLALFSRTEFLLIVVGGVLFIEAGSVALQRAWLALEQRLVEARATGRVEPWRPLVMAPLHHHFEHLMQRELEAAGTAAADARRNVRRRLARTAWALSAVFGILGVLAQYGQYQRRDAVYDWCCVAGLLLIGLTLLLGVATRLRYDAYFLAPDADGTVTLFRGIPWQLGSRRLCDRYETTDIPVTELSRSEERLVLYRLMDTRVEARLAVGMLYLDAAGRRPEVRDACLAQVVRLFEKVPLNRFLLARRQPLLEQLASAYEALDRPGDAVRVLEFAARGLDRPPLLARAEELQRQALDRAETTYAAWRGAPGEATREAALAAHETLLQLVRQRHDRAAAGGESPAWLGEALAVAEERRQRLLPGGEA